MASAFDVTAATFDRYRALPKGVAEAILKTVREAVGAKLAAGAGFRRGNRRALAKRLSKPMVWYCRA